MPSYKINGMRIDELKKDLMEAQTDMRSYFSHSEEYIQLKIFKILARLLTTTLQSLLVGVSIVFVLFFVSLGISFALGEIFESYVVGFLIVGAFYVVVAIILFLFRNHFSRPVIRTFSTYYFDEP